MSSARGTLAHSSEERMALLPPITMDLSRWIARHELPLQHRVESSAFVGAVGTPAPVRYAPARYLAQYPLWVFALDFIDSLDCSCFASSDVAGKLAFLDRVLAQVRPLRRTEQRDAAEPPSGEESMARHVLDAYLEMVDDLAALWGDSAEAAWCLDNVAHCTRQLIDAVRYESAISFQYQADGTLPSLEHYLQTGLFSAASVATGSVVVGFEPTPRQSWERWYPAMLQSCRIVRLANDTAPPNMLREQDEGTVNAVTICLAQLGHSPRGPYTLESPELQAAQQLAREHLCQAHQQFTQLVGDLPADPLGFYVQTATELAVSMYQAGDLIIT